MKKIINVIPLTTSGLIFTIGILGLNVRRFPIINIIIGLLVLFLLILYTIKLFLEKDYIINNLTDSVEAAFLGLYPMIITTLSMYLVNKIYFLGMFLWWFGLLLQVIFMIWFILKYLTPLKSKDFLPTSYIVFSGLAFSSLSSRSYGLEFIGKTIFLISFSFAVLITPIVFRNVVFKKSIKNEYAPTGSMASFPLSCIFLSYIDSFMFPSLEVVVLMLILIFILSTIAMINCLKTFSKIYNKYNVSHTFPFAVTGYAFRVAKTAFAKNNHLFYFPSIGMQMVIDVFTLIILVLVFIQFVKKIILDVKTINN